MRNVYDSPVGKCEGPGSFGMPTLAQEVNKLEKQGVKM
jgi:hypothetical protein